MEKVSIEFAFKIGDIVSHKLVVGSKLLILGRWYEECPGGVQIHYRVRSQTMSLAEFGTKAHQGVQANLETFHQMELEPFDLLFEQISLPTQVAEKTIKWGRRHLQRLEEELERRKAAGETSSDPDV